MTIDAHQHFWVYYPADYPWIDEGMEVLMEDFLPADLELVMPSAGVEGSIAVQARQSLEETQWLLDIAEHSKFIKGVVGWVDLCSPAIDQQLKDLAGNPKLVGVRHVVHDEPDDKFMDRMDFRNGIAMLERHGLTYDILIFPKHLPLAIDLVESFPNQVFILDHLAKPLIKSGKLSPWEADIRQLAKYPNVYCKISGMVTEADWKGWQPRDFTKYLDVVFDCFGPERLMAGSDWPVCTVAGSYSRVWEVVNDYVRQFDPHVQKRVLGGNCAQAYGLQL